MPRDEMRAELLAEIEWALEERNAEIVPAMPMGVEDPFAGAVMVA